MKHGMIIGMIGLALLTACSDPVSKEDEKHIVQTLVDGPLAMGKWEFYWDGNNEDNEPVEAGTYYVRLFTRNFANTIEITAVRGTSGRKNNDTALPVMGDWGLTDILQNDPNPFHIQDGTKIPIVIDATDAGSTVKLTVRDQE